MGEWSYQSALWRGTRMMAMGSLRTLLQAWWVAPTLSPINPQEFLSGDVLSE